MKKSKESRSMISCPGHIELKMHKEVSDQKNVPIVMNQEIFKESKLNYVLSQK